MKHILLYCTKIVLSIALQQGVEMAGKVLINIGEN